MNEKKIAIFIPTYNASKTIVTVLERIPEDIKNKVKEIFILDNNSPDNTYLVGIGYKQEKNLVKKWHTNMRLTRDLI